MIAITETAMRAVREVVDSFCATGMTFWVTVAGADEGAVVLGSGMTCCGTSCTVVGATVVDGARLGVDGGGDGSEGGVDDTGGSEVVGTVVVSEGVSEGVGFTLPDSSTTGVDGATVGSASADAPVAKIATSNAAVTSRARTAWPRKDRAGRAGRGNAGRAGRGNAGRAGRGNMVSSGGFDCMTQPL